jgi:hypothetical protein
MADEGAGAETANSEPIQGKKVIFVLLGMILVQLWIIGLQYRDLNVAENTINVLTKRLGDRPVDIPRRLMQSQ